MRFLSKKMKNAKKMTALFCAAAFSFSVHGNDLSKIQQQIKQQEQKIAAQKREQNKLQSTLKNQETQINGVLGQLRQTEVELKEIHRLMTETDKQIKQLEKQEKNQKDKLAKQVDAMYRSGVNPSTFEKLLSEDAQKAERMKVYYEHMNLARLELIEDLKATQLRLEQDKTLIQSQQKEQQSQLAAQKKQQQELQKVQRERQSTLNQINRSLQKDENRLESLKANEAALRQQIQRAEQAAREQEKREREALAQKKQAEEKKTQKPYQPTAQEKQLMASSSGLGKPRKQYAYPVRGKILNRFGSVQMGELKWKGIVIGASAGSSVRAIADGRVILAGWLRGYGLIVIIKHGENDLSLYGYNQSVSVREGQLVKAGQKIAEVGSSGGQSRSGLYFEIRRKGVAMNPTGWLR
ncbi:murein hydrolase activator EnvC [Actinobacillus seminis]|uniref:Murein hydrolase activator EnvC n=1 Tax=Actinobacillus seminis TaxID=722 RepID=A0A263HB22_9PAST|nr:murein hydrolase activator EnvC [Actinobacillus seminis]OZN24663.1 murein hydrolase activator EnvC [Actinobacillus seminis]SUU38320.1 peptidase M23B [Actinobacillus seminis]